MGGRFSHLCIAAAILCAAGVIAFSEHAVAQTTCPAGSVPITSATRAIATAAGLPASVSCWNPGNTNAGQAAGQAKLWLEQHATNSSNISCLNSQFAEDLEALMQAVPGGPPTITYGYRSPQAQNALPKGSTEVSACGSYHQYGEAADFNNASKQTLLWMRENAPRYGLTPIPSLDLQTGCSKISSFCDPGHIQIAGPLPPRNQCGICSSNGTGVVPATAAPSAVPDDLQYAPATTVYQAPSGYCMVSANPIIYMPCGQSSPLVAPAPSIAPAAPAAPASTQSAAATTLASQTAPSCTPQYLCSNNTIYYQSNTCSTSVFQTCPYGCSGTTCNAAPASSLASSAPTSLAPLDSATPALTIPKGPVLSVSTSATSSTSTKAPFAAGANLYTILQGQLVPATNTAAASASTSTPMYGQQTFSSSSPGAYPYSPESVSTLARLLDELKTALAGFLQHLNPFAGAAQP